MFFETKQQSKRKKKVHFLLIRKMLLHVLLKTRIHFYLCKFLYLQFGHESSAPISFKYAFTMARRLVRLTQPCYLGGSLPRGLQPAPCSRGAAALGAWFPLLEAMETLCAPARSPAQPCQAPLAFERGAASPASRPQEVAVPGWPRFGCAGPRGHRWPGRARRR